MGYQALLFCPDEKLSSVVAQVFTELEFSIDPVHEPFAAVKKLMAQHYDVIVVDSENEQNASLLFKSSRNSSLNQSSLAIALVEGQAGVAKAYRIGANLVLTKPINLEQAKGTLRVARGLLRKNSDVAALSATNTVVAAVPATTEITASTLQPDRRGASARPNRSQTSATQSPWPAKSPQTLVAESRPTIAATTPVAAKTEATKNEDTPLVQPQITIKTEVAVNALQPVSPARGTNDVVEIDRIKKPTESIHAVPTVAPQSFTSGTGAAVAPAPLKVITTQPETKNRIVEAEPETPSHTGPSQADEDLDKLSIEATLAPAGSSMKSSDAPSFASINENTSGEPSGNKKILIVAVIVLALAALGYLGYGKYSKSNTTVAPQPVNTYRDSGQPAPTPQPISSPDTAPSTTPPSGTNSATQKSLSKPGTETPSSKPPATAANSTVNRIASDSTAKTSATSPIEATKPDSSPLLVKSGATKTVNAHADESEPQLPGQIAVASTNDSTLTSLMSSASSSLPKASLSTLKISQGVSEGLLIKRVQPQYPQAALASHAHGAVQILATISKEGYVTNPKVVSGNSILAHAAVEAVRQWRYKPYYLDGQPVEVETQITVNFKTN